MICWNNKNPPACITSTDRGRSCVICQKTTQYDTFIIAQLPEKYKGVSIMLCKKMQKENPGWLSVLQFLRQKADHHSGKAPQARTRHRNDTQGYTEQKPVHCRCALLYPRKRANIHWLISGHEVCTGGSGGLHQKRQAGALQCNAGEYLYAMV